MGEFEIKATKTTELTEDATIQYILGILSKTEKASGEKCTVLAIDPGASAGYCISDGVQWVSGHFAVKDLSQVFRTLQSIYGEFEAVKGDGRGVVVIERPPVLPHMSRVSIQTFALEIGTIAGILQSEILQSDDPDVPIHTILPAQWVSDLCLGSSSKQFRKAILADRRIVDVGITPSSNKTDESDAILLCIAYRHRRLYSSNSLQPFRFQPKGVR